MFSTATFVHLLTINYLSISGSLFRLLYPNIGERLRLYDIFRVVSLQSRLYDILHVHDNVCNSVHGNIRSVYVRIRRLKPGGLQIQDLKQKVILMLQGREVSASLLGK